MMILQNVVAYFKSDRLLVFIVYGVDYQGI